MEGYFWGFILFWLGLFSFSNSFLRQGFTLLTKLNLRFMRIFLHQPPEVMNHHTWLVDSFLKYFFLIYRQKSCMFTGTYTWIWVYTCLSVNLCVHASVHACLHVCVFVFVYLFMICVYVAWLYTWNSDIKCQWFFSAVFLHNIF